MILLISYGNDLRRDDGAGLVLADLIEQSWRIHQVAVKRLSVHQLLPELAEEIARPEVFAVVFVDARAVEAGEIDPRVRIQPLSVASQSPSLGHHLDPATLLAYADWLYAGRPPAWLVTVPAADFGYGEGLSEMVQQALAAAQALPLELLAQLPILGLES
ncbi:MAG: hydrogenase maturation protease [Anaerolineales bacterium]|nr:hydrogenase maturation protease [Anaerolineales bacterium]